MKSHSDIILAWSDEGKLLFMRAFDIDTQRDEMMDCYDAVRRGFNLYLMMSVDRLGTYVNHIIHEE